VEHRCRGVKGADAARNLQGNVTGQLRASRNDFSAQSTVARALKVDDVDEVGLGGHDARKELVEGLAKEDAVVVALFEAYGEVAQEVDGGDQLHSSVLIR